MNTIDVHDSSHLVLPVVNNQLSKGGEDQKVQKISSTSEKHFNNKNSFNSYNSNRRFENIDMNHEQNITNLKHVNKIYGRK